MITNEHCSHCDADMRGEEIPVQYIMEGIYRNLDADTPHYYSRRIGVEYAYGSANHYDGVSEWRCPDCGAREGRWTHRLLAEGESEPRYGGKGA